MTPTSPARRRFLVPTVVALLALGLAVCFAKWPRSQPAPTTSLPARAPLPPGRVHALGRLEPRGQVVSLSPAAGNEAARVEELLVSEGQDIPSQTLVARMDGHARLQAELAEAEARVEAAVARLAQVRAGAKPGDIEAQQAAVELLAEQLRVANRDLERAGRFRSQKAISEEDFERYQWTRDKTALEHRRAQRLLEALAEVRETDVQVHVAEVAAARQAATAAAARLRTAEVRNPTAGRILKIHTRPGEKVADRGLLDLGDVLHMEAVAEVFEGDLQWLQLGQSAAVLVDGTGDRLTGQVTDLGHLVARKAVLSNDPVSDTDARVVEVRITLDPESALRVARLANARVEVTFELSPQRADSGFPPRPQASQEGSQANRPAGESSVAPNPGSHSRPSPGSPQPDLTQPAVNPPPDQRPADDRSQSASPEPPDHDRPDAELVKPAGSSTGHSPAALRRLIRRASTPASMTSPQRATSNPIATTVTTSRLGLSAPA